MLVHGHYAGLIHVKPGDDTPDTLVRRITMFMAQSVTMSTVFSGCIASAFLGSVTFRTPALNAA